MTGFESAVIPKKVILKTNYNKCNRKISKKKNYLSGVFRWVGVRTFVNQPCSCLAGLKRPILDLLSFVLTVP